MKEVINLNRPLENRPKLAAVLNISEEEYLAFESGYTNHSIEGSIDLLIALRG